VLRPPHTALALLVLAKAVHDCLDKNKGTYTTPNPPLAQFASDIADLDAAELATHTRAKGTIAARDEKLAIVRSDLQKIRAYVQGLVDADPANAVSLAQNAGLGLRKATLKTKSEVSAKPNKKTSGSVDVTAKVGGVKASHEWQYGGDGGKTWTDAPPTLQARITLHGFTPGSTALVRHRAVTKTGPDNWSQAVSLIVV
jgi:hypothetical protein